MDEEKNLSETQKLLTAFSDLLELEEIRADIQLLVQAALRAIADRPTYDHDDIAIAILTIPKDLEDDADA